jgi:dual specificity tyrosine-phosphorylation-regulated kinase 2/3/4
VAIKINRNTEIDHQFAQSEFLLLEQLMQEDPLDQHNIVRMSERLFWQSHCIFVFELLHKDLFQHISDHNFQGFDVSVCRAYTQQILCALQFLESRRIIHCDLKPENILLCDAQAQRLKIVDFGSGCKVEDQVYTYVQSRFYRAPEVLLRIPYSTKVDIWSLGCILAELFTGEPLFPGANEQEMLELIMEVQGIPSESLIRRSRKMAHYFDTDFSPFLIEDPDRGILRVPDSRPLASRVPTPDPTMLDFIAKCLELDPDLRFTAS